VSVKHSLLALLNYTPTYGYQLHGLMEAALGDPWAINIGQIYSTLSRLERGGLVVRQLENDEEETDRTIYELTKDGRSELERWFRKPLSRDYRLRDAIYAKLILGYLSDSVPPHEILQSQRKQLLGEMQKLMRKRSEVDVGKELPRHLLLETRCLPLNMKAAQEGVLPRVKKRRMSKYWWNR
jgi:DNA-binding PadR family transcriptional regulator